MVMDHPYGPNAYPNLLYTITPDNFGGHTEKQEIIINTANKLWAELDDNQRQYLFMHALGHLVGIRHYEFGNDSDFTMNDSETIMLPETELSTNKKLWKGFTQWDKDALRTFYPLADPEWTVDCQPAPENNTNILKIGTRYSITAECDHAWVFNPSYTYEVIAADGVVSHRTYGNSLELLFIRSGSCTVVATANDLYGEKDSKGNDYICRTSYTVKATEPVFSCPESIRLGVFCDFKFEVDEAAYPDAECRFTVNEYLFDDETDISVTTVNISKNHVCYRFDDYGEYLAFPHPAAMEGKNRLTTTCTGTFTACPCKSNRITANSSIRSKATCRSVRPFRATPFAGPPIKRTFAWARPMIRFRSESLQRTRTILPNYARSDYPQARQEDHHEENRRKSPPRRKFAAAYTARAALYARPRFPELYRSLQGAVSLRDRYLPRGFLRPARIRRTEERNPYAGFRSRYCPALPEGSPPSARRVIRSQPTFFPCDTAYSPRCTDQAGHRGKHSVRTDDRQPWRRP